MKLYHCAERGCDVVEQPGGEDDAPLCQVCGHPLAFTEEPSESVEQPIADDADPPEMTVRQAPGEAQPEV